MPHTMPVFPTHVGVFLPWGCLFARCCGLPHARGGVSKRVIAKHGLIRSSPRTWGCFHRARPRHARQGVFPTHVGVFLVGTHSLPAALGLPHARGGVSQAQRLCAAHRVSSPRTWGCFQLGQHIRHFAQVLPTHVGVFLVLWALRRSGWRLPHARGGVSNLPTLRPSLLLSSPRTWGCFRRWPPVAGTPEVFPTHVGVFPGDGGPRISPRSLPHARGGVSVSG